MGESKKKVIIACGGTGGHLFPGIAVAQELERRKHCVKLLISEKKVDSQASHKYSDLDFDTIPAVAKPKTLSFRMLYFLWKMFRTISMCKSLMRAFDADVVIGMGGFTSLAPVMAGNKLGLKTFIHDSNALPGKANRLTARWCHTVLLGMETAQSYFPNAEIEITGTPVREEIHSLPEREYAAQKLGLNAALHTILIMGGSQGAMQLNKIVLEASKAMPDAQFIHITGSSDYARVKAEMKEDCSNYKLVDFCDDMASVYAVTDLVVMRAGASSLSEISYLGLPSILIPYPHAADDHQTENAKAFVDAGAAILRQESELDAGMLVADLTLIFEKNQRLEKMSNAAMRLGVKDAAERICRIIENVE